MTPKIIECPRDAMQGIKAFIPTEEKIAYINALLKVGFDTIDFGSFVSPNAIPQMADSGDVVDGLDLSLSNSKLLAIVANKKGAEDACEYEEISYLGFPFSVSETFQKRNTNAGMEEALKRVTQIQNMCLRKKKKLVVYMSMGFGNPYGDPYSLDILLGWVRKIMDLDVKIISISDTIGVANSDLVKTVFSRLVQSYPYIEFGAHLHTKPLQWKGVVEAAYLAGCRRFDGALKGYGGCPMAEDELTGNMPTENLIGFLNERHNNALKLNMEALNEAEDFANQLFSKYI